MREKLLRKIFFTNVYDLKAVEEFLEDMAEQGWMFVKQKGMFYYFKPCQPRKLHFAVDIFDKATIFDTRPEAQTREYIEYCRECGWNFLYTNGKFQIFYSEEEEPVSIQTDDRIKLKLIHKYTLMNRGGLWLLLLIFAYPLVELLTPYETNLVDRFIVDIERLPIALALLGMIIYIIADLVRYVIFYISNKRRIAHGRALQYYSGKNVLGYQKVTLGILSVMMLVDVLGMLMVNTVMGIIMVIVCIIVYIIAFGMEWFRQGNDRLKRRDNILLIVGTNIAVFLFCYAASVILLLGGGLGLFDSNVEKVTVYDEETGENVIWTIRHDDIPLTLEQLGVSVEAPYEQTDKMQNNSFFGSYVTYSQDFFNNINLDETEEMPYLYYDVVTSKWDKILDSYAQDYLEGSQSAFYECEDITEQEAALWKAEKVYSLYVAETGETGRLVRYENQVLWILGKEVEYTQENIAIICEALAL